MVVRSIATGDRPAEYTPIGHSTSLAARMQALAPTGSVAATDATRKLCEGYFTFSSLGPTVVKGVSEPVDVFEVTGIGPLRTRLQRAASRGLTKFVGRQREMEALKHAAQQAQAGHGQVVAVMADPGVGKSRLFYEFKATSQSGWMVLEAFSVSHGKASAYLPVLELLSEYFEISRDDDDRKRGERILGKVLRLDRNLEDVLPYLYSLHGITESGDSLAQMDPQVRRRRTLEAIKRILLRESLNQPLMVIFEDLHWIDSETQALLNLLVDAIANARVLLLVNYHPEYRHEWGSRTHYTQLRLDPLGRESAEEMLSTLLGEEKELLPLKRLIIERTDGTPFFMEEMVQALFDEGVLQRNGAVKLARPLSAVKVPATVQAVLASRIDRLSAPEKELLQTLAVLGREFTLKLVQHVTLKSNDELDVMLAQLQLGEFINEQPAVGEVKYSFKHALTQEVAYKSLLSERRRVLHDRTARSLEELYAQALNEHYGDLAHHYLLSDNAAKAINYAQLAAEQALTRGMYADAISLTDAALKLLDRLPDGSERPRAELALRNIKSVLAFVLHGDSSPEHERTIRRVCELAETIGEKEQLLRGLLTLSSVYFARGESRQGFELAHRCLDLAKATKDDGVLADACYTAGILASTCGALRESVSYLDEAAVHIARTNRRTISGLGLPVGGFSSFRAFPLPWLGRVDEALTLSEEGLRFARNSGDLFFLSFALALRAMIFSFRREPALAQALSAEAIVLSQENGFPEWLTFGHFIHGWAWIELGNLHQGIAELESTIADCRRIGGQPRQQYNISLVAYAYAQMGQSEKGLSMLNEALTEIERTGEKVDQAEMLRLKGEILLMADIGMSDQAVACFRAALAVARAQEAKWWELRASVSLARLLRDTQRRDEARTLVTEIYNWFTEGFDTADLKEAKALLDELGGT